MTIITAMQRGCAGWALGVLVCASSPVTAVELNHSGGSAALFYDAGASIVTRVSHWDDDLPLSNGPALSASHSGSDLANSLSSVSLNGLPPGELPPGVTLTIVHDPATGLVSEQLHVTGDLMIGPVGPLPLPVEAVPHETQTLTAHVVASDPIFLESVPNTTMEFTSESTVVGGINTVTASEAIIVEPTTLSATLGVAAQAEAMLPGSVAMDFIEMPDTVDGGVAVAEPVRARLSTMLPGTAGAVTEHVPAGVAIRGGHLVSGGL